jgi:hypothetical protein
MNSARTNEKKLNNISFNIVNNHHYFGNLTDNKSSYNKHICSLIKFNTNKNKKRNKNFNCINKNLILNITNDNIKTDKNSKNQSSLNNDLKISHKNIAEKRRINTNIYFDKFLESRKLLSSLKKRINFKSILLNNISAKVNQNKMHFKKINKKNENISNNNSDFVNYSTNVKQFKINNNIENKKIHFMKKVIKNNDYIKLKKDLHSSLRGDKLKHKKIKSMKASIFDNIKIKINEKKISKPLKILNVENNLSNNSIGLYFNNNSDLNSNYSNNNTNINSIESNIFKSPVVKSKNLFS